MGLVNKKLAGLTKCVHCNHIFGREELEKSVQILKTGEAIMYQIVCSKCKTSNVIGLLEGEMTGVIGMTTDLDQNDLKKMENDKITEDEVLDLSDVINNL